MHVTNDSYDPFCVFWCQGFPSITLLICWIFRGQWQPLKKFALFCLSFLFFCGSKFLFCGLLERVKHWGDACFPFIILDACSDYYNKSNHTLQVFFITRHNVKMFSFMIWSTKMLTKSLNSPHNPTGKVFTKGELEIIARECCTRNCLAITDEVCTPLLCTDRSSISGFSMV